MRTSAHEYVHELSAFLAALRSGLDFLTMAACRLIPGVKTQSITTLLGMVEKGQTGPVLAVVAKHKKWLVGIRDYRDELVHRALVRAPAAGWKLSQKGSQSIATMPVVVPRTTLPLAFDTRRSRMMDHEVPVGLAYQESLATLTDENGVEQTLHHEVKFLPTAGYIPIDAFMEEHLAAYDKFLSDMFAVLTDLKFQPK